MSMWLFLLATAAGILATMAAFPRKGKKRVDVKPFVALGLFLALFDFAFETVGGIVGIWTSSGSVFPIGFVPVEVFLIAFAAGVAYSIVVPPKFSLKFGIASSLLIAVVGTGIEALLLGAGLLHYAGGWTSWHALVAYFLTFLLLHYVNAKLK